MKSFIFLFPVLAVASAAEGVFRPPTIERTLLTGYGTEQSSEGRFCLYPSQTVTRLVPLDKGGAYYDRLPVSELAEGHMLKTTGGALMVVMLTEHPDGKRRCFGGL